VAASTQPHPSPVPQVRVRRRRRRWPTLLVVLLVLAAVLVAADRFGARAASDELRQRVSSELTARQVSYSSLEVEVAGLPFLTQVARSEFERITIDLTQVRLPAGEDRIAQLPSLHVVATGVHADAIAAYQGTAAVTADKVTGSAVVSYQTLSDLLDLSQYEFAGVHLTDIVFTESGGALRARVQVQALGVDAPIEAAVRLRDARAVGVPLPQLLLDPLSDLANYVLVATLPELPFGLRLDRMDVVGDGLSVTITGHEVQLVRPGRSG
jgi:cell division protein FtsL